MKLILMFFMALTCACSFAQVKATDQQIRLMQYAGCWLSTDSITSTKTSNNPKIRVQAIPVMNNMSLQVGVYEHSEEKWKPILVELISYDSTTDQIVAAGQNKKGQCFIGKGYFDTKNHWEMKDTDHLGELYSTVSFDFINSTEVVLKGTTTNPQEGWEIKYIKDNPKDKNIGIQLVSVKDAMNSDPRGTLIQLSRMGYSYVETYVYSNRSFYGLSPVDFKELVEHCGLKFSGSMTFKSMPDQDEWTQTMNWWKLCIKDHHDAGVKYLTTSNTDLNNITTLKQLEALCDYYNAIGKLCRASGIQFAYHNHADEFKSVESEKIYDFLLKHTDPSLVSFQADLYWIKKGGVKPETYFTQYPGRFFSWHIKDETELGASGEVDFRNIFNCAKQAGLIYSVVEVEKYNYPPLTSVEMAYRFLYIFI